MGKDGTIYTDPMAPGRRISNGGNPVRSVFLVVILMTAVVLAPAAEQTSLTGKWQLHLSIAGNESDATCDLTQSGNELSGACRAETGTAKLAGKVEANKVTWSYKIDYNGSPLTLQYSGTLGAESKINGSVTVEEFGVAGEFTAAPAK